LKLPVTGSDDAASPKGGSDAIVAFFPDTGDAAGTAGDEGVAGTFLRRGVAAALA